jgi:hypothetical protein
MVTQFRRSNTWRMWGNAPQSSSIASTTFQTLPPLDRFIISFLPYSLPPSLTQNRVVLLMTAYSGLNLSLSQPSPLSDEREPKGRTGNHEWRSRSPELLSGRLCPNRAMWALMVALSISANPNVVDVGMLQAAAASDRPIGVQSHPLWGNLAPHAPLCISQPSTVRSSRNLAAGYSYYPSTLLSL